ncbi:Chitin deacetylase [Leucoagaricus sp. SymC.cos]|nr:Chitin deacetylase [Leucoagaricus sp. SymC.cos]
MLFASLLLVAPVLAASVPNSESHDHSVERPLGARWYHEDDHPVYNLFRRGGLTDGVVYQPVGSPSWAANFPASTPDSSQLPPAWVNALNAAVSTGKIPDVPVAERNPGGDPKYPDGLDPMSPLVCSSTYKCQNTAAWWDGPEGYFASSFDDGPQPTTDELVAFLQKNNVHTTHFMIGVNILQYWKEFLTAFEAGDDIAVHTYTHPYMTTLSNEDVVAQLGWTMELIHNSTGGRVPRFWRPPYGDSDNRVTAIAKEVFGLETVIWNEDTEDWSLGSGGTSLETISKQFGEWLARPKSPGLVILEHEDSNDAYNAFTDAFPRITENGWKFESLARLFGQGQAYQNSLDNNSEVKPYDLLTGTNNGSMTMAQSSSVAPSLPMSSDSGSPTAGNLAASSPTPETTTNDATSARGGAGSLMWVLTTLLEASVMTAVTLWV